MSIPLARQAMRNFLSSKQPEVLCIRGKWGTGKTYAWNSALKDPTAKIGLPRYSYVSLFGIDSLDALKTAIFENSISTDTVDKSPSVDSLSANLMAIGNQFGRKSLKYLFQNPVTGHYLGGLQAATFLAIRETIVCIDDLERAGKGLGLRDILGLASFLKTERKCKVVIILNSEKLDDAGKADFESYFEKVIDVAIEFAPSADECAEIALSSTNETDETMRRYCVALGISNIRVIKQIQRLIYIIEPQLVKFDPRVQKQAIQSLILFGWSKYTEDAPTIAFLRDVRGDVTNPEKLNDNEKEWNSLLDKYGFSSADEFDLELIEGIERGYFDEAAIAETAGELNSQIKAEQIDRSFSEAWGLFHNSFENNSAQVTATMEPAFRKAVKRITPVNLNATVRLFKDLGETEKAKELITFYVENRRETPKLFDMDEYPFANHIDDPDVQAAFAAQVKAVVDTRNPADVLLQMARQSGWSYEDITLLSKLEVDDYCTIFRNAGSGLRRMVGACLQFNKVAGTTDKHKEIARRAETALQNLGSENLINRLRVQRLGIKVP